MGKAFNGKTKSVKPKSDHAARKYETRVVGIDAVAPHPRNTAYHAHPDAQIEMLAQSAQTFGQYKNIVVWKKQIIAGAGIWAGLKKAGATEIEIKDVSHLTQAQAFALMTADNETQKGAVTNDAELAALVREVMEAEGEALARLAAGEQKALDALLAQGNAVEETADVGELIDRAAELQKKWNVARGDIFEVESKTARGKFHRLMCGDSTSKEDVERLMGGEKAGMVFTDPPYNVSYQDNETVESLKKRNRRMDGLTISNDSMTDAEFDNFLCSFLLEFPLSKGGAFYLCAPPGRPETQFRNALNCVSGLTLRQCIVWVKDVFVFGRQDYHWRHESILYGWKDGAAHFFADDRTQDTVWEIERPRNSEEHPTMKPLALAVRAISNSSKANEIIFDGFNGSGTTLIACEQTGRIGRGMELEPKYVSVALERLSALGLEPRRVTETEKRNGKQKRA